MAIFDIIFLSNETGIPTRGPSGRLGFLKHRTTTGMSQQKNHVQAWFQGRTNPAIAVAWEESSAAVAVQGGPHPLGSHYPSGNSK